MFCESTVFVNLIGIILIQLAMKCKILLMNQNIQKLNTTTDTKILYSNIKNYTVPDHNKSDRASLVSISGTLAK